MGALQTACCKRLQARRNWFFNTRRGWQRDDAFGMPTRGKMISMFELASWSVGQGATGRGCPVHRNPLVVAVVCFELTAAIGIRRGKKPGGCCARLAARSLPDALALLANPNRKSCVRWHAHRGGRSPTRLCLSIGTEPRPPYPCATGTHFGDWVAKQRRRSFSLRSRLGSASLWASGSCFEPPAFVAGLDDVGMTGKALRNPFDH